jgi:DNA polymerase delta subunit 1
LDTLTGCRDENKSWSIRVLSDATENALTFILLTPSTLCDMATTLLPQKRVLAETTNARRNIPSTPAITKKRKVEPFTSSPAPRFASSQNGAHSKLSSSQPKSAFEAEVLEKLSQDISSLKHKNSEKDQAWERPPVADFNPRADSLCFQAIEAEEGTLNGGRATVKLFGVNAAGNSVMLHVTDFKHYLYVAAPVSFQPQDCPAYKAYLETQLAQHQPAIHSVSMTMRESIYGYQGGVQSPYLKVAVTDPKHISRVRVAIEKGEANWKGMWKTGDGTVLTFDNLQYVLRFMVDCKVRSRKLLALRTH